jgi:8-oxo-dGTP pyrophosphatase MutT (NUDIX family)
MYIVYMRKTMPAKHPEKLYYRPTVFMVVYSLGKEIRYLVLHRTLHWNGWEFPKGGIEKREKNRDAILRELKEETGLKPVKIADMKIRGRFDYPRLHPDRPCVKGQSWRLFAVEVAGKKIRIDCREHDRYKWLGFASAHRILTWSDQRRCLKATDIVLRKRF